MTLRELAIDRLLATDPRQSVLHTLDLLRAHTQATRAGLFVMRGGVGELFAGHGIDQASLDWLRGRWGSHRKGLDRGRPCFEGTRCLWPLPGGQGEEAAAFLYLDGAPAGLSEASARAAVEAVGDLLSRSVTMADQALHLSPDVDVYLKTASPRSVLRRQLEGLLHDNEWNVSRVARVLGVTRMTVYARMERLGIMRLRVPKVP
jgi:hypothetical protein